MLTEGPADTIRYRPEGEAGPLYLLRVPRGFDAPRFKAEVETEGGRRWLLLDQAAELNAAVRRLVPDDAEQRQQFLFQVEEWSDRLADAIRRLQAGEMQDAEGNAAPEFLAALEMPEGCKIVADLAQRHDRGYRRVGADNAQYPWIAGIVAARMFLVGWEAPEGWEPRLPPFRRGVDGVPGALIDQLPREHVIGIGVEIGNRIELPRPTRKNSASPSGGGAGTPTSSTSPTPAASDPSTETSPGTMPRSA